MAQIYHFTNRVGRNAVDQGATFERPFTIANDYGQPTDLTGHTFRMQIRATIEGAVVLELTTANGRIPIEDAEAGKFKILLTATETASLTAGFYVYDLEWVDGSKVTRLFEGQLEVSREVTR
jgi:hypothetical protein